jgi:hypothetical protein
MAIPRRSFLFAYEDIKDHTVVSSPVGRVVSLSLITAGAAALPIHASSPIDLAFPFPPSGGVFSCRDSRAI